MQREASIMVGQVPSFRCRRRIRAHVLHSHLSHHRDARSNSSWRPWRVLAPGLVFGQLLEPVVADRTWVTSSAMLYRGSAPTSVSPIFSASSLISS